MAGPYHIVALIPAHDEGPRIAVVVETTAQHLPVVVVDDGSADGTAAQAEAAGATVLRQAPNAGKGAALRAGFRFALDSGFEAVVTLDADGQHDPSDIPRFLEAYTAHAAARAGLIIGRRRFAEMPLTRRLSNVVGGVVLSAAVGRWIPDNQSGFRLVGRTLMREMLESVESGFEFEVEMIARWIALRRPIRWVPIRTIYLGETSHIRPWRHLTGFIRGTRGARAIVRRGR